MHNFWIKKNTVMKVAKYVDWNLLLLCKHGKYGEESGTIPQI